MECKIALHSEFKKVINSRSKDILSILNKLKNLPSTDFYEYFTKETCLGEGAYGKVYAVPSIFGNKVVKIMPVHDDDSTEAYFKEILNHFWAKQISPHHVLIMHCFFISDIKGYIIYDRADLNLHEYYNCDNRMDCKEENELTSNIIMTMEKFRTNKLHHLDVKPDNIMLVKNGKSYHFFIHDWGIAFNYNILNDVSFYLQKDIHSYSEMSNVAIIGNDKVNYNKSLQIVNFIIKEYGKVERVFSEWELDNLFTDINLDVYSKYQNNLVFYIRAIKESASNMMFIDKIIKTNKYSKQELDQALIVASKMNIGSRGLSIIKVLISKGANVNMTHLHRSSIMNCILNGKYNTLKLLLENKADPNLRHFKGNNSLIQCTRMIEALAPSKINLLIETLLVHKADINQQDDDGNTALHKAVKYRHRPTIKCLLRNGAKFDILNKNNKTVETMLHSQNIRLV
jgi:serine/threonine protein kinase